MHPRYSQQAPDNDDLYQNVMSFLVSQVEGYDFLFIKSNVHNPTLAALTYWNLPELTLLHESWDRQFLTHQSQ
jgi:hypothetical protein